MCNRLVFFAEKEKIDYLCHTNKEIVQTVLLHILPIVPKGFENI